MTRYILKRCLWMIVVVVGAAIVVFTLLYVTPGDPGRIILGTNANYEEVAALDEKLGLNRPYIVQLADFLYQSFIKWDWGTSWTYKTPVMQELIARLPRTVGMGLASMIIGLLGIPLGVFAATHQGRWQDYGVLGICMVFVSLPELWVALMLIILFSLKMGWLPSYGIGGIQYYILPVLSSVMGNIANNARQARSAVLEVRRADFITTARAKGQTNRKVLTKHIIPNAMMPIITILGSGFARVVAGTTIIEMVFTIPGVGLYMMTGINNRDYPVIRSCTLFMAIFSSVCVLLTDLCYAVLDPRIKAQYIESSKKRGAGK